MHTLHVSFERCLLINQVANNMHMYLELARLLRDCQRQRSVITPVMNPELQQHTSCAVSLDIACCGFMEASVIVLAMTVSA